MRVRLDLNGLATSSFLREVPVSGLFLVLSGGLVSCCVEAATPAVLTGLNILVFLSFLVTKGFSGLFIALFLLLALTSSLLFSSTIREIGAMEDLVEWAFTTVAVSPSGMDEEPGWNC